eukprot:819942-Rhodomonas_salina.1
MARLRVLLLRRRARVGFVVRDCQGIEKFLLGEPFARREGTPLVCLLGLSGGGVGQCLVDRSLPLRQVSCKVSGRLSAWRCAGPEG